MASTERLADDRIQRYLGTKEVVVLATLGADGAPHGMAMWFLHTPDAILMLTRRRPAEGARPAARSPRRRGGGERGGGRHPRRGGARARRDPRRLSRAAGLRRGFPVQVPSATRAALGRPGHAVQSRHVQDRAQPCPELGARVTAGDAEFLYLTTTGRRSGQPREIEIWFTRHEGRYYLVAEHRDKANWVQNLRANPQVHVRVADATFEATARVVDGERGAGAMRADSGALREEVRVGRRSDRGDHADRRRDHAAATEAETTPPASRRRSRRVQMRGSARGRREAWSPSVERAAAGANEADGPLSTASAG